MRQPNDRPCRFLSSISIVRPTLKAHKNVMQLRLLFFFFGQRLHRLHGGKSICECVERLGARIYWLDAFGNFARGDFQSHRRRFLVDICVYLDFSNGENFWFIKTSRYSCYWNWIELQIRFIFTCRSFSTNAIRLCSAANEILFSRILKSDWYWHCHRIVENHSINYVVHEVLHTNARLIVGAGYHNL